MKIGALQESPGYEPVDIEPADDGSRNGLRRQPSGWRQCRLDRAKVQMMLFMVAQPLTFVFWSWALHRELPSVQQAFGSEGRVINVLLFYLVFSALVVVMFPLGVIDLAAGFLFGVWLGFPVALATKTSGSVLCFLLSRHTCSEYLRRTLVEHYDWLAALSLMMRERQYQTMALLRFSVIPAALKNYGCGSLSVSLRVYAIVTAVALSLESFMLVPVGAKIVSLQDMTSRKRTPQEMVAIFLGIILLLALCLAIRRTVRLKIEGIQREAADRRSREVGGLQGEGMDVFESAHEGHSGGGGGGRGGGAGGGRGNRRVPSLSPGRGLAGKSRPASVSSF